MTMRRRDRVIALVLAIMFFVVSFGTSFLVIYQLYKDLFLIHI